MIVCQYTSLTLKTLLFMMMESEVLNPCGEELLQKSVQVSLHFLPCTCLDPLQIQVFAFLTVYNATFHQL